MANFGEQPSSSRIEDFDQAEKGEANLKDQINTATASGDFEKVSALAQEAGKLKGTKEKIKGMDQEEAEKENAERTMFDEAKAEDTERTLYDEAKVEDAAREKVKLAEQASAQAEKDNAAAAEVLKEIQGMGVKKPEENKDPIIIENVEAGNSQEDIVEKLGKPKTEMFEKFGEKMRQAADELVVVAKEIEECEKEIKKMQHDYGEAGSDMAKKGEITKAHSELIIKKGTLIERRSELISDATWGSRVIKFRDKKYDESYASYEKYKSEENNKYSEAAMDDPYVILRMAEADQLGTGYSVNEGIGKLNERLRSNLEFMTKILDSISRGGAESFWAHVRGEARNRELYIAAVKKNHLNYQWGSKEWKSDPEIQEVAIESGLSPAYLYEGKA